MIGFSFPFSVGTGSGGAPLWESGSKTSGTASSGGFPLPSLVMSIFINEESSAIHNDKGREFFLFLYFEIRTFDFFTFPHGLFPCTGSLSSDFG